MVSAWRLVVQVRAVGSERSSYQREENDQKLHDGEFSEISKATPDKRRQRKVHIYLQLTSWYWKSTTVHTLELSYPTPSPRLRARRSSHTSIAAIPSRASFGLRGQ